ncbi:MAG: UDP-N-acetylmuramate dehydrogenase [Lachnospiraceae bacterium]|nr:UDP-N-acetylmuramate dehydrogenase [Lachnospiraceae bacterium]
MSFYDKLVDIAGEDFVKENEILSRHSTMKIGGAAKYFVNVKSFDELSKIVKLCNDEAVRFMLIGNGSNIIFRDEGYDGVIICTDSKESQIASVEFYPGNEITDKLSEKEYTDIEDSLFDYYCFAGAGIRLANLVNQATALSLSGLEFAGGIPGTVGGAVFMNAGAYGGEIKDSIIAAKVLTSDGEFKVIAAADLKLRYRGSAVQDEGYFVVEALFGMNKGNKEEITARIKELNQKRRDKQPLEYPSCGSTFKRPVNGYAAQMIEECGLKGERVGDMMISEKHAGFMINVGNGTCEDALKLVKIVQDKVQAEKGVLLEMEPLIVG